MNSFHLKIAGGVALLMFAVMGIDCSTSSRAMQSCMRSHFHGLVSEVLLFASLGAGVWIGVRTADASKRNWLGWVVGIAIAFALGSFFAWLGFETHSSD